MDIADNQSNWRAWFANYGPRLLLFARQQTKTLSDAEDVLQEAMVRSWKNHNECGKPVIARVYQAIRYATMDLGRRDTRRKIRELRVQEPESNESNWFVCPLEEKERNRTLQDAMKNLPLEQREVLVLKIWGEMTFEEIGRTLNISPNTAASRYRYALGSLKKVLTPAIL